MKWEKELEKNKEWNEERLSYENRGAKTDGLSLEMEKRRRQKENKPQELRETLVGKTDTKMQGRENEAWYNSPLRLLYNEEDDSSLTLNWASRVLPESLMHYRILFHLLNVVHSILCYTPERLRCFYL